MTPKKKSMVDPIIYGVCLLVVLYVAVHAAAVYEYVHYMVETGDIETSAQIMTFITLLSERMLSKPFTITINQYTQKYVIYGAFGWLIVVLSIVNSKKNYIHGKEFGTARWGTLADIRDLFADNILKDEIKKAKQMRWKIGRWKVRSNTYKEVRQNELQIEKVELEKLREQEAARKKNKTYNKKLHNEQVKAIKDATKVRIEESKRRAWLPDQLAYDYNLRLKEIAESPLYDGKERKVQEQKAKAEYEQALSDFYDTSKKIEKAKAKYKDADMLFTKTERISMYNWKLNNNTLILGGSGSGKTRGYVMPNILQAHSSYIVTDPKGEILEKAGYFLSEVKGYKIRVLNLDEKTLSDGYNPFVYIHPERDGYEERVLSLITTIIVNTDGGEKKGGSDPFWDKAEQLFLQAIFFFTCDGFPLEERTMNTAVNLIAMLQIAEDEDNYDSDLDYFAKMFEEKFGSDHIGVLQWKEFRQKASGKTAKSIVISAVARLAPFRTKAVRKIFSYDSMHLDRVGEEKTAVFVVVPPTDDTFNFIAGMLFTQLFQELQYCATQVHKHDGQRLPVPCRFILDEFANTCTIPNFVKILAYARSFGIGITPILQSLEQIKNMYKDEWGVIVDNCNTMLYLGSITHMDTLEYMSKLLGKGTFDKRTTGRTRGRQGSSSENFDVVGRELMTPDEIQKIPKSNCMLIVGGRHPFYSEKYDYPSHPNYRFTSDGGAPSYHFTPDPPPWEKEDKENSYPHREDEKTTEERVVLPEPDEQAVVDVEEVKLISDPNKQLKELTAHFAELQPISDKLMNDGELTAEQEEQFLEALMGREERAAGQAIQLMEPSEETRQFLENIGKDDVKPIDNPIILVNILGRIARELAPVSDSLYNDGDISTEEQAQAAETVKAMKVETEATESEQEPVTAEKADTAADESEEALDFEMDEDENAQEMKDALEETYNLIESLSAMVESTPEYQELLEESA